MEVGGIIAVSTVIAIIGGREGCEFDYEMKGCHPGEKFLRIQGSFGHCPPFVNPHTLFSLFRFGSSLLGSVPLLQSHKNLVSVSALLSGKFLQKSGKFLQ